MIFSRDGLIGIEGTRIKLLVELSTIMNSLHEKGITKEELIEAVDIACKSDAEREEAAKKATLDLLDKLTKMFGEDLAREIIKGMSKKRGVDERE